ncbi:MAG TPA: acyl-CoA dehydrogenase family protein [Acidimicrobiales bacterium]|jgi:alkylation response protein AidB-like acyl-CoA dehydrogenase|nr:acyl-CoA dehydrogenase family protein [Acidimicrobiales bacterium]
MDFNLDETQQEIADLARRILEDRVDHPRLKMIEAGNEWFDRDTFRELAKAGLVGIALREDVGGGGMTIVELAQVLEAQGRTVAPLPLLPTAAAALAIDEYGTPAQRTQYLPGVAEGTTVLSIALQEYLNDDVLAPNTVAASSPSGWTLTGTKVMVEYAEQASRVLVAARVGDGVGVFLVDPHDTGASLVRGVTSRREPVHELHLEAALATDAIGTPGDAASVLEWIAQRTLGLLCAIQLGVTDKQLHMTAEYTSQREQFGRPIATFQAVTQRLANAYIDVEAIRLCTYSALWRLANGLDASEDLRIAKWFASDGAHHIAHGAQHMHGGAGVDVENPLHRYTLWSKHIEGSLGAGTASLRALGTQLAATD